MPNMKQQPVCVVVTIMVDKSGNVQVCIIGSELSKSVPNNDNSVLELMKQLRQVCKYLLGLNCYKIFFDGLMFELPSEKAGNTRNAKKARKAFPPAFPWFTFLHTRTLWITDASGYDENDDVDDNYSDRSGEEDSVHKICLTPHIGDESKCMVAAYRSTGWAMEIKNTLLFFGTEEENNTSNFCF